ncbi:MAG: hypothetical protein A2020_01700 [Lentisphaerae bacterium GWF2_45_14]|nr:MAG: hypothetical protein A2020_01700 [Lentisphaerae bacterium GWF2_45_14]
MSNNNVIKILSGICVGRLADESTDTALLHRSDISAVNCSRCKNTKSKCFQSEKIGGSRDGQASGLKKNGN